MIEVLLINQNFIQETEPIQTNWLGFTIAAENTKPIRPIQSAPRYFFTQTKEVKPVDVLDKLPTPLVLPFKIVDTIWDTSVNVTALSIKTMFYPHILTYRFIRRRVF